MALINLLAALVRRVVSFPLFQLLVTIVIILFLQAADSKTVFGEIFNALDVLVDYSVRVCAAIFEVKSFTKSWLTTGFMIAYVYMAGLLMLFLAKLAITALVELAARSNALWLRNAIARERGIEAYRAWLPLERIRPANIPQQQWEERFAWPADNKPPYPSLAHRVVRATVTYVIAVLVIVALLEAFTPLPVLTWLGKAVKMLWTAAA
jgi:hypothetical protein